MKIDYERYTCVVSGKPVKTIDCRKTDIKRTECVEWWKANYTKENGAFWYLTEKLQKDEEN